MNEKRKHPSPAMVVAMIALCLGLGGSAIAAGDLTKRDVKKIAKKQAKRAIKRAAPKLSVAHAVTSDRAAVAGNGATAYGTFNPDGTLQPGSRGLDNLTVSDAGGVYCEDQDFTAVAATPGVRAGVPAPRLEVAAVSKRMLENAGDPDNYGCPAGTRWMYWVFQDSQGFVPGHFSVVAF